MNNIQKFLENFKNTDGFKGKIKKAFFKWAVGGFEAVNADIEDVAGVTADVKKENQRLENKLQSLTTDFEKLCENVRNINSELETLHLMHNDFENLSVNVRNNNALIEKIQSESELCKVKIHGIQRELKNNVNCIPAENAVKREVTAEIPSEHTSDYDDIDYFDFENHFRGSIENIKKSQKFYLKYFEGRKNVLDIGCGRGEFLSLLKENGVNAKGVDIYQPYVDYCLMQGLDAVCGDGTAYLASLDGTDGIFVGQVVEHLEPHQIINLCNKAYEKLAEGSCIVIETPNPTSLAIYTNAFYIDPSHIKPVHPLTMKYYLEKAGFRNIEIIYTENSRPPYKIPELKCTECENTAEFNKAMQKVSDIIFGSQDYAVVAVK